MHANFDSPMVCLKPAAKGDVKLADEDVGIISVAADGKRELEGFEDMKLPPTEDGDMIDGCCCCIAIAFISCC